MMVETQASRIREQEETIKELRAMVDELRSLKANLEETLEEFRRQFLGVRSEKTSPTKKKTTDGRKTVNVKAHTRERKPKATREELRITPAKVERIRYMQEVLLCPECKKDHEGSFKKGMVPSALVPHSPASASAVTFVMFNKCFMGLPYYRQESALEQLGAKIPREILAN